MRGWILLMMGSWLGCASSAGPPAATGAVVDVRSTGASAADERGPCLALDSADLSTRVGAAASIARAHYLSGEGGTEQRLEAAATWCREQFGLAPSWMQPASADRALPDTDVGLVVGGMFSPDHIGPERFAEVQRDVIARPVAYLDALDALLASAPPELLAESWPSVLIALTLSGARERSIASVRAAIAIYRATERSASDRTMLWSLAQRREALEALAP